MKQKVTLDDLEVKFKKFGEIEIDSKNNPSLYIEREKAIKIIGRIQNMHSVFEQQSKESNIFIIPFLTGTNMGPLDIALSGQYSKNIQIVPLLLQTSKSIICIKL
ncbi:hypothetical protein ACTA71_001308 [Dictyostelium dimigraforme]